MSAACDKAIAGIRQLACPVGFLRNVSQVSRGWLHLLTSSTRALTVSHTKRG